MDQSSPLGFRRRASGRGRLRSWRAVAGVLAIAAGATVTAGLVVAPAASAAAHRSDTVARPPARPSGGGCIIKEHAAFRPSTVIEGKRTTLVVVLHDCTKQSLTVDNTQFGFLVCVTADPLNRMVTIGAHESVAIRTQYRTPACAGTGHITARVTSPSGQPLAERTAALVIMAPPSEPTG